MTTIQKIPRWHRFHHAALRDAAVAFLDLRKRPQADQQFALHLTLTHYEEAHIDRCMYLAGVNSLQIKAYARLDKRWGDMVKAKEHYAAQLVQSDPRQFVGACLLNISVHRMIDQNDDATYTVVVPIEAAAAKEAPFLYWDALLRLRLSEGYYLNPNTHELLSRAKKMYGKDAVNALRSSPRDPVQESYVASKHRSHATRTRAELTNLALDRCPPRGAGYAHDHTLLSGMFDRHPAPRHSQIRRQDRGDDGRGVEPGGGRTRRASDRSHRGLREA